MDDSEIYTRQPSQGYNFTVFGNLPKELRDMIWDFAIRDARPAESRDAMERRYRIANHPNPQNVLGRAIGNSTGRSGICNTNDNHEKEEKQYFTILAQDLVCFQVHELSEFDLVAYCLGFVKHKSFDGANHVALEYDPNWEIMEEDDFNAGYPHPGGYIDSLVLAKANLTCTMWFIDYRIRRSRDPSRSRVGIRDGRNVFYGNGCRFVSVDPSDTEWEYGDGTPLSVEGHNVFMFVNDMAKAEHLYEYSGDRGFHDHWAFRIERQHYDQRSVWEYQWFQEDNKYDFQHLGVLACEVYGGPAVNT
ncbi:hypothetical protein M434DRAFT_18535 [Hypoxylon sp. CO27-5]|nr:hypothetical protein M434DRAFT_18535 [Hypoxylon sp. CO27-5]